eukprot:3667569-Prorocentrum_lima.AAC.1
MAHSLTASPHVWRENVRSNIGPVNQCTANMTAMSDERVALPIKVDVAIRFDMHDSGRAANQEDLCWLGDAKIPLGRRTGNSPLQLRGVCWTAEHVALFQHDARILRKACRKMA